MRTRLSGKVHFVIAVLFLAGWGSGRVLAGAPYMGLGCGDVIVATVRKVSEDGATNRNPPRVELEAHEVLRGDPKADRSHAVWLPWPHDIDYVGSDSAERLERWKARPLRGPSVGGKMILWIEGSGVLPQGRFPYSDEKRAWAVKMIEDAEQRRREYEKQLEADRIARAEAVRKWRASVAAADIEKYVAEADLVAVGKIVSGVTSPFYDVQIGFEITEILKGQKRKEGYPDGRYFADLSIPKQFHGLLDHDTEYLLFLSENGMRLTCSAPFYPRISSGDGIVIADESSREAVSLALKDVTTRPAAGPVIIVDVHGRYFPPTEDWRGLIRRIEKCFEEAAEGRCTVVLSGPLFSNAGHESAANQTRKRVPSAEFVVLCYFDWPDGSEPPPTRLTVTAVKIEAKDNRVVLKEEWALGDEEEMLEKAAKAVKDMLGSEGPQDVSTSP